MEIDGKRKKNIWRCGYVVDVEACMKFVQWTPGNIERLFQKNIGLWQGQINTHHLWDDRLAHTMMVSLSMHQPAFGKMKWMGINRLGNHVPRIQLIQQDTTMVWSSMNPSGQHTTIVSLSMHPPAFGKKKWMGISCPCNHIPQIQLIQEETTMVWP